MRFVSPSRAYVAREIVLDGRLALFHERQRWLAMADIHFGFELSQRAAGNLFPLWGMRTIEDRFLELLGDYRPKHLVLLGDLVHDRAGAQGFAGLIERLREKCEVILISGNHDRKAWKLGASPTSERKLVESWAHDEFYFHHGDCVTERPGCVQIIGHHHPAGVLRDGAGLRLKLPAFVQQQNCWILPAFSPWAGGVAWPNEEQGRIWLCSPERVLEVDERVVS